ncbi:sulfurtransferase [Evansella sp. AB-rgal1]|uniref:sulfurtransferase n=1 Tax=Evansella sp. AB-rgal1 TaxID=3242696 RepID=UPI00359EFBE1
MIYKNIVTSEELRDRVEDKSVVIVDCRFQLGEPTKGLEEFNKDHLTGALYFDLEKDLSATISKHGGRHPLPNIEKFVQLLSRVGIDSSKKVIAYDDQGGAMAARLWWMLKYVGHDNVAILNEGFSHWKKKGYPTTKEVVESEPTNFVPNIQYNMLQSKEEVMDSLNDPNVLLIDSRAEERFTGKIEPIDPVAGHIPGAVNEDWQHRLTKTGEWKSKEDLEKDLGKYRDDRKQLIVYCGSGVTACANIIALTELGLKPKLYAGSWSDWITYEENSVEVGK